MLDIIIVILLAFGAFRGFRKGLLMELITIVAFVIGIILGVKLMDLSGSFLHLLHDNFGRIAPFVLFLVIFVLTIVVVNQIGRAVKKALNFTPLGSLDNFAGAFIGALKWAFAISLVFWVTSLIGLDMPVHVLNQSQLHPYVISIAPLVFDYAATLIPFTRDFFDSAGSF
jgi:membrane protein required for colicin V production